MPAPTKPHARREHADQHPKGRRCLENGCITLLNIWNPGPYCLLHAARYEAELLADEVEEFNARQSRGLCDSFTRRGLPCNRERAFGSPYCPAHAHLREEAADLMAA